MCGQRRDGGMRANSDAAETRNWIPESIITLKQRETDAGRAMYCNTIYRRDVGSWVVSGNQIQSPWNHSYTDNVHHEWHDNDWRHVLPASQCSRPTRTAQCTASHYSTLAKQTVTLSRLKSTSISTQWPWTMTFCSPCKTVYTNTQCSNCRKRAGGQWRGRRNSGLERPASQVLFKLFCGVKQKTGDNPTPTIQTLQICLNTITWTNFG